MALSLADVIRDLQSGEPHGGLNPRVLFHTTIDVEIDSYDDNSNRPIVFVPDLHILSRTPADAYGDYFNLSQDRESLLMQVLRRLLVLKTADTDYLRLRVLQLGDFHDLWREREHWWWHEDIRHMMQRQLADHRDLFSLFSQLATERLVGNHDDGLRDALSNAATRQELQAEPIAELFPVDRLYPDYISMRWGTFSRIGIIHADRFDRTETGFFSFFNPIGARAAQHNGINIGETDEWRRELRPPGTPDPLPDQELLQQNVDFLDTELPNKRKTYYAEAQDFFTRSAIDAASRPSGHLAAVVIGHTHSPRIVEAKGRMTLVDCGSWVNTSTRADDTSLIWNAQLGILTGNEISVVQFGN